MVGGQSKYNSSFRLPGFQACSSRSSFLWFSGVKGKCGQLGRITTACYAERYMKSKTFASRKDKTDRPEQSLLGTAVWVNESCLLSDADIVLRQ